MKDENDNLIIRAKDMIPAEKICGAEFKVPKAYYRVSVKAKIIQDGKLILVKEDDKTWDLPGGGVEHGETVEEALKRELNEEIGLADFKIKSAPQAFAMIDRENNRPLLFLTYCIELPKEVELNPGSNVEIGRFEHSDIPETVNYAKEYADFIRKKF